jgi:hypothetical protein
MNDVIKQFNKRAEEIKPTHHQRALKMAALKALQNEHAKHRDTKRGLFFNFLSMSFTKTVAVGLGVLVVAVAAVAGWNPIMQRLGFDTSKTVHANAQELLKLTRGQYNMLTLEERKRLAETVQGSLEQIWQEAEQAKDLRFLQGSELQKILMEDTHRALGIEFSSSTVDLSQEIEKNFSANKLKQSVFRYTDDQGKIVYINLATYETLPEGLVLSSKTSIGVVKLNTTPPEKSFKETMEVEFAPKKTRQWEQKAREITQKITPEFKIKVQEIMEKKLQKYYPEVLVKWRGAKDRELHVYSLLDGEAFKKNNMNSKFYVPEKKLEMLHNNIEVTIQEFDANRIPSFDTYYAIQAYLIDEQGKHYFITGIFDSSKPDAIENQIMIQREK